MAEMLSVLFEKLITDTGIATTLLFVGLIATNWYHIKMHRMYRAQDREDLASAWNSIWQMAEGTNRALSDINGTLLVIKDRTERS